MSILCLICLIFVALHSQFGDAELLTTCTCPNHKEYITFKGSCENPDDVMVIKETLIGRTIDRSNPLFCNQSIELDQPPCIQRDEKSSWPVKSTCNGRPGICFISWYINTNVLSQCPSTDGYLYGCLQYECVTYNATAEDRGSKLAATNTIRMVHLGSSTQKSYEVGPTFHIMTSYYPSYTSTSINQCTISVPASDNVLLKIHDIRSRFIGVHDGAQPYCLSIKAGLQSKQWCVDSVSWTYEELISGGSSDTGVRFIDILFNSVYPDNTIEGAAWLTVESSGQGASVLCGAGIPLHQTTGH